MLSKKRPLPLGSRQELCLFNLTSAVMPPWVSGNWKSFLMAHLPAIPFVAYRIFLHSAQIIYAFLSAKECTDLIHPTTQELAALQYIPLD